jgi:hypothetical protein
MSHSIRASRVLLFTAKRFSCFLFFALLALIANSTRGALAIDANTSSDRSTAASAVTTSAFSTSSGNELLLAFVATDSLSGPNTTVTSVTGGGLTWVLVRRTNVQSGNSEIWRAFSFSPLSNVTVTATLSQSVVSSMTVMSFTGVDTSGTNGSGAIGATGTGNSSRGAPTANLTTTRNGSWVAGVGNDFDNAISRTPGAGQHLVHQYLTPSRDTYWVQMQNAPTPASGTSVTINDSAPATDRYNLSLCEILAISGAPQQPQITGQWVTLPYTMPINPIHVGLLHTGKVLIVAGSENDPNTHNLGQSKAAVWNLAAGTITRTPDLTWDVFCNGWAFFPDGRCLVIGGTAQYAPFYGDSRTTVFDPLGQKFSQMQYMAHGRWYATGIVLADGRIMAFSGLNENGVVDNQVEFYTVGSGWSSPFTAPFNPNLYPWLHVLPDGRVFNSGGSPSSNMFNPNPPSPTWMVNFAKTSTGLNRTYGNSVLLPLLPANNYAARVMILGGGVNPPAYATATTEMIDFSKPNPAWVKMGDMPSGARVEGNSVLLPTGKLFVQGGSKINENASTATLGADLFDPATGSWSSANPGGAGFAKFARLYHSVALLLPDATVATAGSNPQGGQYDNHIEIYSPAYLFDANGNPAARPVITGAPSVVGYNSVPFQVQTPDALNIGSVVLVKPGSDTHAYDMEQRLVGLTFSATSGALTVNAPPNSNLAPPGYYMLFVLNQAGVPSVARFVQVSQNPTDKPPKGTITAPTGDVTIKVGQAVNFAGTASDPDGSVRSYSWFFPEGTPESSTAPSPGAVVFSNPGTYVASLTAVDDKGVNDPSPPTRTITVQPPAGSIAVDASSSADGPTISTTISTAVSTASANELLLAFVATDYYSGANTTVTGVSGGGLNWALVRRTNVQSGTSEIWRAFSTSTLNSATVTATLSQGASSSLTVMSFTGVDTSGANGSGAIGATGTGNSSRGAPTASLTTTRNGSWVVAVGNDYDYAISRTPGATQMVVHQYLSPLADTFWVQRQNTAIPASGTLVTINDTAPTTDRFNLSMCEILPAP